MPKSDPDNYNHLSQDETRTLITQRLAQEERAHFDAKLNLEMEEAVTESRSGWSDEQKKAHIQVYRDQLASVEARLKVLRSKAKSSS